ncbi:hypothetical protein RJ640_011891 [Escallonia rubra]|uniref:RIN4 pathogenic type III effector avirulence factor Avr cleavage site domain-containing protein n=1 Tax=Escallonia rubra TaxID=112253 RepID=A0AA88RIT9_9ASTE|nr:hypothetical protein RJ640_011891 [Escallonia rubra]
MACLRWVFEGFGVVGYSEEKGRPLPKFGEWDVNDPASAEGFTVIFNKARNEKKTGGKPDSPPKDDSVFKHGATLGKPQSTWKTLAPTINADSNIALWIALRLTPRLTALHKGKQKETKVIPISSVALINVNGYIICVTKFTKIV